MIKKFKIITVAIMLLLLFGSLQVQPVSAASKPWYAATTYSDSSKVKVTIDNGSKMTNKDVTITIDASKYNNGDNVIVFNPDFTNNNFIVTYGNKFTTKVSENGQYDFMVERREYYDPKYGDPNTIWCGAEIKNIDKTKPTFKKSRTFIDSWGNDMFLRVTFHDNVAIKRIKLPSGEYIGADLLAGDNKGNSEYQFEIYKNGNYTFEAEDYAGNKTKKTITVKNSNPAPLKINKITTKSNYVTGKTVPYGTLIVKSDDLDYFVDTQADKKGNFKVKLSKKAKSKKEISVTVKTLIGNYNSNKIYVKVYKK